MAVLFCVLLRVYYGLFLRAERMNSWGLNIFFMQRNVLHRLWVANKLNRTSPRMSCRCEDIEGRGRKGMIRLPRDILVCQESWHLGSVPLRDRNHFAGEYGEFVNDGSARMDGEVTGAEIAGWGFLSRPREGLLFHPCRHVHPWILVIELVFRMLRQLQPFCNALKPFNCHFYVYINTNIFILLLKRYNYK
jgi:hypothetical protein